MSTSWRRARPKEIPTRHRSSLLPAAVPMALLVAWVAVLHFRTQERLLSAALASNMTGLTAPTRPAVERSLVAVVIGPVDDAVNTANTARLFEWLADEAGLVPAKPVACPDEATAIDALASGRGQIAILSAEGYVRAKRLNPALDVLATELRWDDGRTKLVDATAVCVVALKSTGTANAVITPGDRPRVAFTSGDSLHGYRYPIALLAGAGMAHGSFTETFTPDPAAALLAGTTDLATLTETALRQARTKSGDVFRVVAQSQPLPNRCVVASASLPTDVRAKLAGLLADVDPSLVDGLGAHGFVRRPDAFYDATRRLLDAIR